MAPDTKPRAKLSSSLARVIEHMKTHGVPPKEARVDGEGRIEVLITVEGARGEGISEMERMGLKIGIYDEAGGLVEGWATPGEIERLMTLPFVKFIDLPNYGVSN
jgi:hypothetical protein